MAPKFNSKNDQSQQTFEVRESFKLFKPYQQGKGAAAFFEYSPQNNSIFLSIWPENAGDGPKFSKEGSITAKLGLADIGSMLTVLNRRVKGVGKEEDGKFRGLFHKNPSGSTVIEFFVGDKGLRLGLSSDRNGEKNRIGIGITAGEAEILLLFFNTFVPKMFKEDSNKGGQSQSKAEERVAESLDEDDDGIGF